MAEYIERSYIRKMAMLEMAYTMETETDAAVVLRMIDDAPAADVAPVVRCKDCKHKGWVQEPCHGKSVDYCKVWDCTLRNLETTFCSYGERKENDHAAD